ncbi:MAG: serine/threonine-protein phosphatase [Deltaproteobacteria bacterium]|nr:serine/threonine-protein phosphatase [Deltaproteobacteria bacterium]
MMFVTAFLGVLNFKTGEFLFSNAGHHPPLIIRSGQKPEWLQLPDGFLLGVMADAIYRTERVLLNPGDKILLYTDGVTEAMNRDKIAYSNKRLMSIVEESKSDSGEAIIREVIQSIKEFTGDDPYSDDVTLLTVHLKGRRGV